MEVELSEIFIFKTKEAQYSKESLMAMDINREFTDQLAKYLGLTYMERIEAEENLCYAQNPNIRSGYRMVFSKSDILNYLDRQLKPCVPYNKSDTIFFPENMGW